MSDNHSSDSARYPIGDFSKPEMITPADRRAWIRDIAECHERMQDVIAGLSDSQLDTPYREGGWTVRQLVHHVPDSHLNAYVRTRLALTEDDPVIKTYEESRWAVLEDARTMPVDTSLRLLHALHERWVRLFESLAETDFKRAFVHPELGKMTIETQMALYSWHCRHHAAHIRALRDRMNW